MAHPLAYIERPLRRACDLCRTCLHEATSRVATLFDECKRLIKKILICQLQLSEGVTMWGAVSSMRFYLPIPIAATL